MKQIYKIKNKLSSLLFAGIVILCLTFVFINCGKGPQKKIINANSGQCAVDFSAVNDGGTALYFVSSELLKRQGSEVTAEGWVKRKTATLDGPVVSRQSNQGAMLWVKDNEPKFAIRLLVAGTSTDFIVNSNVSLAQNTWNHLAGVLVNAVHSHPSSTSCTPAVMAETPHMDIYVNGQFANCASTGSKSIPTLTCAPEELGVGVCAGDSLGVGVFIGSLPSDGAGALGRFGIIDDARYWTTARTESQILECMNQELVMHDSGDCGIDNPNLAAYVKLNECSGSSPSDWTGLGAGSKENPATVPWDGGWVSGAPITPKD